MFKTLAITLAGVTLAAPAFAQGLPGEPPALIAPAQQPPGKPLPEACKTALICSADGRVQVTADEEGQLTPGWRLGNISVTVLNDKDAASANTPVEFTLVNADTKQPLHKEQRTTNAQGKADLYQGGANIDYVPADGLNLRWTVTANKSSVQTPVFARPEAKPAELIDVPEGTWPSAAKNPLSKEAATGHTYTKPTKIIRVTEGAWEHKHDSLAVVLAQLSGKVGPQDLIELQLYGQLHHLPKKIDLNGATLRIVGIDSDEGQPELVRYTPDPEEHEVATVEVNSPVELINVVIQPQNSPGAALDFKADAYLDKVTVKHKPVPFEDDNTNTFNWSRRLAQSVDRANNPVLTVHPGVANKPVTLTVARSSFENVGGVRVDGPNTRAVIHTSIFNGVPFTAAGLHTGDQTNRPSVFVHNTVDITKGGHAVSLKSVGHLVADSNITGKERLVSPETLTKIQDAATTGPFTRMFEKVKDLIPRLGDPTIAVDAAPGITTDKVTIEGVDVTAGKVTNAKAPAPTPPGGGSSGGGPVRPPAPQPPVVKPSVSPSPSAGPSTRPGTAKEERIAGQNRIETAIAINRARGVQAPKRVFIASADNPADAVAAAPLAAAQNAPLFVTWKDKVDPALANELAKVVTPETWVTFLGGEAAITKGVADQLGAKAKQVDRLAGLNRADTATKIADELVKHRQRAQVIVADGQGWHAPIVVSPAAIKTKQIVLLSNGEQAAPETMKWLRANQEVKVTATIGAAGKAHQSGTPITGANPAELSLAVAKAFFTKPQQVGAATALKPTDAMVAGPFLGDAPILLVDNGLSRAQAQWLKEQPVSTVTIFGGPQAVEKL